MLFILENFLSCKNLESVENFALTLVNDQLHAQFSYFIIRILQSSTCFEQRRAHHQEVRFY